MSDDGDVLLDIDPGELDVDDALALVRAIGVRQSRLEAARLAAMQRCQTLLAEDEWCQDLLATELRVSMGRAGDDMALAHTLATRLPRTRAALAEGSLDIARVRQIERATAALSAEHAEQVEQRLFPAATEAHPRLLYQRARAAVLAVDPDGAAERAAVRREQRRVSLEHEHDGMSWLHALLSTEDALAAHTLIDTLAHQARDARDAADERSMDELRADALRDLLLGSERSRVVTHVYVTARASTLFGLDELPGHLRGVGAIPAEQLRRMAYQFNATWRGVRTSEHDTITGHCRLAEKRYRPSATLTELIHLRDGTCRFPACTRAAERCDIDHHTPYQHGGTTCPCNCDTLCRRHHRLKHTGEWTVEHHTNGELTWTTPTGTQHTDTPEPLIVATTAPTSDPPPF